MSSRIPSTRQVRHHIRHINTIKKGDAYRPTCIYVTSFGFECLLYRNNTTTFYSLQSGGELLRTEAYLAVESVIHVDNVLGTR